MAYLAFDFGAESGRSIVGSIQNDKLTLTETHRFANPNGLINGQLQWDVLGQWLQIKQGLKQSVARFADIRSIGVDTWGVDFGLLDSTGQLLGNPVCYRDARTDRIMEKAFAIVDRSSIYQQTGIQFMQFNTLFQLLALQQQNPKLLELSKQMLFMPDLFHYLLTGVAKNEYSIASTSQMLEPNSRDWNRPLLDKLNIPTHMLGQVVPAGTRLGRLRDEVCTELGINPIDVVAPASHDTASAVLAVPASGGDWCYLSSGTWSLMGVELSAPLVNDQTLALNYTNEGGFNSTIRLLKNIMGLWLVQECRRAFEAEGRRYDYATLTKLAGEATPFAAMIDPNDSTFLAPGEFPRKIKAFLEKTKQPADFSDGQLVRICLDSLAMEYRRTVEGLEQLLGRRLSTIHIVGGGTQNQLLNQLTADVCGKTVIAGPIEATAAGNILAQALATGELRDIAHARQIIANSFPMHRYEPKTDATTQQAYQRYLGIVG